MLGKFLKYSVFLLFLILLSCTQENNALLNSVEDYGVESVEDGTFLEAGASVNIVFTEIGTRATLVQITLEGEDHLEIASAAVEPEILKGLGMPLDLPSDLEEGIYYLRFTVYDEDIQLYQDQRYFFIGDGIYSINNLETYPPGIKPGDSISARIVMSYPITSDPWLRWTLAGKVLQEGPLSEMGTECRFSVPEEGGVYSLRVEVFPVMPGEEQISSIYRNSDLFVNPGESGDLPWKFIEDRTYLYFIDFSDSLLNRMNPADVPRVTGEPVSSVQDLYTGLSFSVGDGILFAGYALPLSSEGSVEDFHMTMAFSLTEIPETGEYSVFQTGDDLNHFSVRYSADKKEFIAEFKSYSQFFQSSLPLDSLLSREMIFLELSYSSLPQVASLSWMNNGNMVVRDESLPLNSLSGGETRLGSDGLKPGLPVIWYTFAVSSEGPDSEGESIDTSEKHIQPVELSEEGILYRRSETEVREIVLENIIPGNGLASLVIIHEPDTADAWVLDISDAQKNTLYTMTVNSPEADVSLGTSLNGLPETGIGEGVDKLVISLINDDRGFFLSSSADDVMIGPFLFQDILNIKIEALSGGSLDNISDIRFFQD